MLPPEQHRQGELATMWLKDTEQIDNFAMDLIPPEDPITWADVVAFCQENCSPEDIFDRTWREDHPEYAFKY